MKILKYILFAIMLLGSEQISLSQYYLKAKSDSISLESDSVLLFIDEYRGTVNWQKSSDLINWVSMNKHKDTMAIRIDSSAYYRATIIEGDCNPVMSDTAFLIEEVTITGSNQFTVDNTGGVFLLPSGIKVKVPKGAVIEPKVIRLDTLSSDSVKTLAAISNTALTAFLSGISIATDTFDFKKPIKIKIPLPKINETNLPVLHKLQNENNTWSISDETMIVGSGEKFIEIILNGSDQKGTLTKGDPGFFKDIINFFITAYESVVFGIDPCKRNSTYLVITKDVDYLNTGGGECQVVSSDQEIIFWDCDPPQIDYFKVTEISPTCVPKLKISPEGDLKLKKYESSSIKLTAAIGEHPLPDQEIRLSTSSNLYISDQVIYTGTDGSSSFSVTGIEAGVGTINVLVSYEYYLTKIFAEANGQKYEDAIDTVKLTQEYEINVTVYDIPEVSTAFSSDIACMTETVGGDVTSDGGETVTERGIFWGTSQNPELTGTKVPLGSGTGPFSTILSGLTPNTTYYVEAYAINLAGTGYGIQVSFSTSDMDNHVSITSAVIDSTCSTYISWTIVNTDDIQSVTDHGVYFGKYPDPELTGKKVSFGPQVDPVDTLGLKITVRNPETSYVRGYATTECGTVYGNQVIYTPENLGTITDIDGNVYTIVTIGTQVWMAENLKTTKYSDGTNIPLVADKNDWSDLEDNTTAGYCWYLNDETYKNNYGALYNWWTVGTGKLCPTGWHVPNYNEWATLINFVGGETVAGGKLKEVGTLHWHSPNEGATNEVCFTALPGNARLYSGDFYGEGHWGFFWSSTGNEEWMYFAWFLKIYNNETRAVLSNFRKNDGYSVRCIKDN